MYKKSMRIAVAGILGMYLCCGCSKADKPKDMVEAFLEVHFEVTETDMEMFSLAYQSAEPEAHKEAMAKYRDYLHQVYGQYLEEAVLDTLEANVLVDELAYVVHRYFADINLMAIEVNLSEASEEKNTYLYEVLLELEDTKTSTPHEIKMEGHAVVSLGDEDMKVSYISMAHLPVEIIESLTQRVAD